MCETMGVGPALDLYRAQHGELLRAAAALRERADLGALGPASGEIVRAALARLGGKLHVHLMMEDRSLYPELLASPVPEVRATARRFQEGTPAFRRSLEALFARWLRPAAVERAPAEFVAEVTPLLAVLTERIAAEDRELFPLAERE
jgi:hemerythrin-like domain-containing protein